jgi:tripartite-type tricarboxylate transporter receptor subunit TctC
MQPKGLSRAWLVAALVGFALARPGSGARAAGEDARAFFQGKTLQFFTMGSPGGGYDAYTRAIAAQLEQKLGVRALTINEPAAGGLVAMNRLLVAKPDGLSLILVGGEGLALSPLLGEPGVNYDILKQVWLARVSAENKVALLGPKSPFKSLQEMIASQRPVVWAGSSKSDGNTDFQCILAYATGMKAKMIIGYKGTGGMNLALQNGEVDGRVVSDEAAALYGPTSGMRVVTTLARKRAKQFPDVPTIFEAVKLDANGARLLDWRAGVASLGRVIAVTPGSPPDRVEVLRAALKEILTDPAFVAEMKNLKLTVNFADAERVRTMMARAMTTLDKKALAEVKAIVIDRYY